MDVVPVSVIEYSAIASSVSVFEESVQKVKRRLLSLDIHLVDLGDPVPLGSDAKKAPAFLLCVPLG